MKKYYTIVSIFVLIGCSGAEFETQNSVPIGGNNSNPLSHIANTGGKENTDVHTGGSFQSVGGSIVSLGGSSVGAGGVMNGGAGDTNHKAGTPGMAQGGGFAGGNPTMETGGVGGINNIGGTSTGGGISNNTGGAEMTAYIEFIPKRFYNIIGFRNEYIPDIKHFQPGLNERFKIENVQGYDAIIAGGIQKDIVQDCAGWALSL